MTTVTKTAESVEEAVKAALEELGTTKDQVNIEVIQEPSAGFLGVGKKDAEVKVTLIDKEQRMLQLTLLQRSFQVSEFTAIWIPTGKMILSTFQ